MLVLKVKSNMNEAQEFHIFVLNFSDFRMTKINVDCVLAEPFLGNVQSNVEGFKLGSFHA